jgi:hypothetical protein
MSAIKERLGQPEFLGELDGLESTAWLISWLSIVFNLFNKLSVAWSRCRQWVVAQMSGTGGYASVNDIMDDLD